MDVSVVQAIQTQGRASSTFDRWVYTYRVKYSQDCVTFNSLLDANGNNKVRRCLEWLMQGRIFKILWLSEIWLELLTPFHSDQSTYSDFKGNLTILNVSSPEYTYIACCEFRGREHGNTNHFMSFIKL